MKARDPLALARRLMVKKNYAYARAGEVKSGEPSGDYVDF
jgi:hypothetical protein